MYKDRHRTCGQPHESRTPEGMTMVNKIPGALGTNEKIFLNKNERFSHIQIAQKISKIKIYFFDEKLISKSWVVNIFFEILRFKVTFT